MALIRPMQPDDADAVRAVDVQAFASYVQPKGAGGMPLRTRENVLACLALNPEGCFVAEADGLVGYIFSRVWGALGWIGVFGVRPDQHSRGVGHQLLAAAVARLQAAGCTTIGLETMPDRAYNVGLYTRAGFRPVHSTIVLGKPIQGTVQSPPFALLSELGGGALAAAGEVSDAALPGLDYAAEARNAREYAWGDTLLIGWPEPWAVAVVRTVAKREGPGGWPAEIAALAIHPRAQARAGEAVAAVEAFAAAQGLSQARVPVNAANWPALQALLACGFRVEQVALRLLLKGDYCPRGAEFSRWAM